MIRYSRLASRRHLRRQVAADILLGDREIALADVGAVDARDHRVGVLGAQRGRRRVATASASRRPRRQRRREAGKRERVMRAILGVRG